MEDIGLFEELKVPKDVVPYAAIQDMVSNLDEGNVDATYTRILHYQSLMPEDFKRFISSEIARVPYIRTFSVEAVFKLCVLMLNDTFYHELLLNETIFHSPAVLYRLFQYGSFTFAEIKNKFVYYRCYCRTIMFFFREIPNIKSFIEYFEQFYLYNDLIQALNKNPSAIPDLIKYGWETNSIGYFLKYDLESELQQLMNNPTIKIDKLLKWSYFESAKEPSKLNPLSLAAYFGSTRCFKSIILAYPESKCDFTDAVFGGSLEIIHMIFSSSILSPKHLFAASYVRKDDVLLWILQNCGETTLNPAEFMKTNNIKSLFRALNSGSDIKMQTEATPSTSPYPGLYTAIHYAAEFGYIYLVSYLLDKGSDINSRNSAFRL